MGLTQPPTWDKITQTAKSAADNRAEIGVIKGLADKTKKREWGALFQGLLADDLVVEDQIDAVAARITYNSLMRRIGIKAVLLMVLVGLVVVFLPIVRPIHRYVGMTPEKRVLDLSPLTTANHTDQAILSWAAAGITEIMTFGFGDFDQRVLAQRSRFTNDGWESFTKSIREVNLRSEIKARQLVLTTVPSNTPVIVSKGVDLDNEYKWIVEMPIIETYMTNNNVTSRKKEIVRLTIVRVPSEKNISGIGIKSWKLI